MASPDFPFGQPDILNNIVDRRAKCSPRAPYAEFPISATSYDQGYRKVTYADLANAINGAAWWLEKTLGRSETFGPNDLRYNVLILAAVKVGFKVGRSHKQERPEKMLNMAGTTDASYITSQQHSSSR